MPTPTMRAIAEKAGVSTASVSMALRNSRQISDATKKRILEIAHDLGYRPNPMVSSLMTHIRTGKKASSGTTLAILGPQGTRKTLTGQSGFDYPKILYQSILARAEALGYKVELFSADKDEGSIEQLQRVIHYRNIRGIIIPPFPTTHIDKKISIEQSSAAIVAIGYSQDIDQVNRVAHDQSKIAYEITKKCLTRGYQRIGLMMQDTFNTRTGYHYISSFLGAHFDAGRPIEEKLLRIRDHDNLEDVLEWIDKLSIDCLIVQDPQMLNYLRDAAYRIPEDLGLAALSCQKNDPEISGMYHNPLELGQVAVDIVTAHLQRNEFGRPVIPKTVTIEPEWREGRTLRSG